LVDDDLTATPAATVESQHTESSEPAVVDPQTNRRATRAIDIFSLGCVFYYVLTRGGHPYDKDGKFMREANIVKGYHHLEELQRLGDYAFEADDLIRRMLSLNPRQRWVARSFTLPFRRLTPLGPMLLPSLCIRFSGLPPSGSVSSAMFLIISSLSLETRHRRHCFTWSPSRWT